MSKSAKKEERKESKESNAFAEFLEGAFIVTASVIAFGIGLLDLFGLLDSVPFLVTRIPILTLLLLSLCLGLFFLLRSRVDAIDDIKKGLVQTQQDINLVLSQRVLADIESSLGQIDADLRLVFESDIRDLLGSIVLALKEKSIRITQLETYRYYYIRTLDQFPRATIWATSIPSATYFWRNPAVENAIAKFIESGGTFKRIFFLEDIEDVEKDEVQDILRKQLEINVEAYIVPKNAVNIALYTLFVVESNGRIGWDIYTDAAKRIQSVVATSDQNKTRRLREIFEQLLQIQETRRVTTADILQPAVVYEVHGGDTNLLTGA